MIESRSGTTATIKVVEDSWFADQAQPLDCTTTEATMEWHELLAMHAAGKVPETNFVKSALTRGVPHAMRPEVWLKFSGAAARMEKHPHVYAQLCSRVAAAAELREQELEAAEAGGSGGDSSSTDRNPMRAVVEQVEKDLRRTEAGTEGEKLNALRRVLCAFASFNPEVGYVQGMNFIAAGFLATLNEECSFWMLVLVVQVAPAASSPSVSVHARHHLVAHHLLALPCCSTSRLLSACRSLPTSGLAARPLLQSHGRQPRRLPRARATDRRASSGDVGAAQGARRVDSAGARC